MQKLLKMEDNNEVIIHLWDTGGEERFKALAPHYYKDALGALLIYDIGNT